MAAYDWDTLKHLWEHDQMSMEQVIGQLIMWSEQTHQESAAHHRQLAAFEREVALLTTRVTALESQRPRK